MVNTPVRTLIYSLVVVFIFFENTFSAPPIAGAGTCLSFDGVDDDIYIDQGWGISAWTLEFWIKPNNTDDNDRIFIQGYDAYATRQLMAVWDNADDQIEFKTSTSGAAGVANIASSTIPDNNSTWTHVAWTFDGITHNVYVNGTPSPGSVNATKNYGITGYTYIGCRADTLNHFNGSLDEVRLWQVVKSQTDIQNNMYRSLTDTTSAEMDGLLNYYRFDEGSGTTAIDYTDVLQNGIISGATYVTSEAWRNRSTDEYTPLTFFAGYDDDKDALTFNNVTSPTYGGLFFDHGTGQITYIPSFLPSTQADNFTFQVDDGGQNDQYAMTMTVNSINNPPSAGSGNALDFDGNDDFVAIPALNLNSNTVTISAWIKRNGAQNNATAVMMCRGANTEAALNIYSNSELRYHWNGDHWNWKSGLIVPDNQWTFVALVIEQTQATIYMNTNSAVNSDAHAIEEFDTTLQLGRDKNFSNRYFRGSIDEVRIWNTARSAAELSSDMYTAIVGNEANLVGYWRMDDASGIMLRDYSASKKHGLLFNMTDADWVASDAWAARTATGPLTHSAGYDPDVITLNSITQVTAPGNGALSFDAGARTVTYTPNVSYNGPDTYTFQVSDGTATDNFTMNITVSQTVPPTFSTHPSSDTVAVNDPVSFIASADGSPPITYQWQTHTSGAWADISGETGTTYSIGSASVAHIGWYRAIATNAFGSDTSDSAYLHVATSPPTFSTHPSSDTVELNDPASFTAIADGSAPITYQWQTDTSGSWADISGATGTAYDILSTTFSHTGNYRSIATNPYGTATSNTAFLLIYDSSIIQSDPANDTVLTGDTATFGIKATGASLVYKWEKRPSGGSFETVPGATSDTLKHEAASGDNNAWFRCIVQSGPVYDTSEVAVLTLGTIPTITSSFSSDTVIPVNGDLTLTGSATAMPPPTYQWFFIRPGSAPVPKNTGTTLSLVGAPKDSAGTYYFVATNRFGSTSSDSIFVHILTPVSISTNLPPSYTAIHGSGAVLNIVASGDSTVHYQWYESDTVLPGQTNSSLNIPSVDSAIHDGNTYHCRVWNTYLGVTVGTAQSVTCTLKVGDYYNPFKVKVERIDIHNTTQVRVKLWSDVDITNFPSTDANPFAPWSDSVWVLYNTSNYPIDPQQQNTVVAMYSTDEIKQATDTVAKVLTVLELQPGGTSPFTHDSCYWFNSSTLWHVPSARDTLLRPLLPSDKVFMLDTTGSPNRLEVSGQYYDKTDSAKVTIDSINALNVSNDSLVVLQYSKYSSMTPFMFIDTFTVAELINAGNTYSYTIQNLGTLPIEKYPLYCRWFIIGTNTSISAKKSSYFDVGWDRPVWTGTLDAVQGARSDRINLTWSDQGTIDSMRVWWNTDTIPYEHDYTTLYQITAEPPHYVINLTGTADSIVNLSPDQLYYFGAQIFKDDMWSRISSVSSDSAKTKKWDIDDTVPNIIKIDSSWFDEVTNEVAVNWHIDNSQTPPLSVFKVGYSYNLGTVLDTGATIHGIDSIKADSNKTDFQIPSLYWDTVYTIGLWLGFETVNGNSRFAKPTDSSTCSMDIPPFTWQIVTFFTTPGTNGEVVQAANGKIILRETNDFLEPEQDTLRAYHPNASSLPEGLFLIDALSFKFCRSNYQIPDFVLELPYTSLPQGITENDLGLYQDRNGDIHVIYGFSVDGAKKVVSAPVGNDDLNGSPFLVLADTTTPVITYATHNEKVDIGSDIPTDFTITDNISNVRCTFMYGRGDKGYDHVDNAILSSDTYKGVILENTGVINQSYGVRALLVADDGINYDTSNVSRCVKTEYTETYSIPEMEWTPLRVAATLKDSSLENIFNRASSDEWEYNKKKIRLFRYYDPDSGEVNSYMEYSESKKKHFNFVPGRLIWCKKKTGQSLGFGEGATTSMRNPYAIKLKAGTWTDFCLPFQFSIRLKDVLDATGAMSDSLLDFYHWVKDGKTYSADKMRIALIDMRKPVNDTMVSGQRSDGYTVKNNSSSDLILKIPPISLPLSPGYQVKRSSKTDDMWDISFLWKEKDKHNIFREVICAYNKNVGDKTVFGSLPPSMSRISIGILDSVNNSIHGYAISNSAEKGGMCFKVAFHNTSEAGTCIEYRLDNLDALPEGYLARVLNPSTRLYESCNDSLVSELALSPGTGSVTERLVVVGTSEYLDNVLRWISPAAFAFLKAYPNPFNGAIKLHYTLPPDISELHITLYNVLGRTIWKTVRRKGVTAGEHIFTFNSRTDLNNSGILPNGVYILRLSAKNRSGEIVFGGEKRITCIK
jgi:hypothetical protein